MFTFVISLVVVGAGLAIAARIVMNGGQQPATEQAARDRGRTQIGRLQPQDAVATPWWVRARAVVLLTLLLAVLGGFVALLVLLGGALVLSGLKNAVQ